MRVLLSSRIFRCLSSFPNYYLQAFSPCAVAVPLAVLATPRCWCWSCSTLFIQTFHRIAFSYKFRQRLLDDFRTSFRFVCLPRGYLCCVHLLPPSRPPHKLCRKLHSGRGLRGTPSFRTAVRWRLKIASSVSLIVSIAANYFPILVAQDINNPIFVSTWHTRLCIYDYTFYFYMCVSYCNTWMIGLK